MKKIIFILSLSSLAFAACSKPNTDAHESNTAPEQPMTQVTTTQPSTSQPATADDTAETSLDWPGEYKGVLPCADCQGIKTELKLNADKTYELEQEYLGKGKDSEFKVKGTFGFDAGNPTIIILDQAANHRKFLVGKNFVEARDINSGKAMSAKMNYKLKKDID